MVNHLKKWIMAYLLLAAVATAVFIMMEKVVNPDEPLAKGGPKGPEMPAVTLDAAQAEALYKQSCLSCHGGNLEGGIGLPLNKVGSKMDTEAIYKLIHAGKGSMPAFEGQLKDEEIAQLAAWLSEKK
ncbi:cytochrome c [Paenibacillus sp. SC116]|uniref:c-type cytochrome n=1 Tax=Paenibacillus sp. SC116 TaxID=2968986 RepID=UPI00215A99B0|nr:cytochrome c [Paenibacillus sp. SC116]MCR8845547.1 cytochrome c [Paenibacillus sp. SC116]